MENIEEHTASSSSPAERPQRKLKGERQRARVKLEMELEEQELDLEQSEIEEELEKDEEDEEDEQEKLPFVRSDRGDERRKRKAEKLEEEMDKLFNSLSKSGIKRLEGRDRFVADFMEGTAVLSTDKHKRNMQKKTKAARAVQRVEGEKKKKATNAATADTRVVKGYISYRYPAKSHLL